MLNESSIMGGQGGPVKTQQQQIEVEVLQLQLLGGLPAVASSRCPAPGCTKTCSRERIDSDGCRWYNWEKAKAHARKGG